MKKMSFYRKQYGFSEKELELIRKRFDTISKKKGKMNKDNFRESLGLLGLEHATFLSDRLFNIINTQNNGQISY